MASAGKGARPRRVLIIVQNLPVPFDQRVWNIARTLAAHNYTVSVICPKARGFEASYELLGGVHIHRHPLLHEAKSALGYLIEYPASLFWQFILAWKIWFARGFDAIHACNPPDTIFIIAGFFKLFFRKRFLFDHHDLCPELYEAKFKRRGPVYGALLLLERLTFAMADISIATNNSYRSIALTRGGMKAERVFTVRSGPDLDRMRILPPDASYKNGRNYLVGYLGVMGKQEGLTYLLDAISHIVHDRKRGDIQFILIGSGEMLEALKQRAQANNIAPYITFTGRIPDADMLAALNSADICVNPDEVNAMNDKSTMNKIMEYMALAKPIVQFEMTEGRTSAADASLYAHPNDAQDLAEKILMLLDDKPLRATMGAFGRRRVETLLAWEYEAPKLIRAYEALFVRI